MGTFGILFLIRYLRSVPIFSSSELFRYSEVKYLFWSDILLSVMSPRAVGAPRQHNGRRLSRRRAPAARWRRQFETRLPREVIRDEGKETMITINAALLSAK